MAAFARKAVAGLAAGMAIAAPMLVAFESYLSNGYVAQHAGDAASRVLPGAYLSMSVAPYLFGRIGANGFPEIHYAVGRASAATPASRCSLSPSRRCSGGAIAACASCSPRGSG